MDGPSARGMFVARWGCDCMSIICAAAHTGGGGISMIITYSV